MATPFEIKNNRYTGKLADKPNIQAGKVYHLNKWLANKNTTYATTFAYSDSHNDLPLLEWADTAICVSPDDKLTQIAIEKNWQFVDWTIYS